MKPIVLASLLTTTILALSTLHPHDGGIAGAETSISIMLYPSTNCQGNPSLSTELLYGMQYARQLKSYSLGHDLDDQTITLYADKGWKLNSPTGYGQLVGDDGNARRVV